MLGFQSRLSASDSPVSDEFAMPVVSSQMSPGASLAGSSVSPTSLGFILCSEPIRSALLLS